MQAHAVCRSQKVGTDYPLPHRARLLLVAERVFVSTSDGTRRVPTTLSNADLAGQIFSGFWAGGLGRMRRDSLRRHEPLPPRPLSRKGRGERYEEQILYALRETSASKHCSYAPSSAPAAHLLSQGEKGVGAARNRGKSSNLRPAIVGLTATGRNRLRR